MPPTLYQALLTKAADVMREVGGFSEAPLLTVPAAQRALSPAPASHMCHISTSAGRLARDHVVKTSYLAANFT